VYGLVNLAQLCHQIDPGRWPETVRTHFPGMDEARASEGRLDDWPYARETLKDSVHRRSDLPPPTRENAVTTPLAPDLVGVLVHDLPTTVRTVGRAQAPGWPEPIDALFGIALEHLAVEAEAMERTQIDAGDGVALTALVGTSFFVASEVLRLGDLAGPRAPGHVVSLPNRHHLVWHTIGSMATTIQSINVLGPMAAAMYEEGPGSVTPEVFWWHDGALTPLGARLDGRTFVVAPPQAFVDLLEELGEDEPG
jgi:hypothetical protein